MSPSAFEYVSLLRFPDPGPALAIRTIRRIASLAAFTCALSGCIDLAPPHQRPDAPVPATWLQRGAADDGAVTTDVGPDWQTFVHDDRLRRVIGRALVQNRDLRIAILNVEKARALYRVQAAQRVPFVGADASGTRTRSDGLTTTAYTATLDANFEIDLFSRVRNLSDAALASYFATRENRRGAELTLIAEVADAWLTLAADEGQRVLAQRTLDNRTSSFTLTTKIHDLGGTTGLAVAQARSIVASTRVQLAGAVTQVALDRNALELLIGEPLDAADAPVVSDPILPVDASALFDVPAGLPSTVLVHRPDVQASERNLMATNATIGAARAAFFPRITLTGSAGAESSALAQVFRRGSAFWSIGPSITLPIFDGGANRATLDNAIADRDIAIAAYQKTLQTAFREVADVLAARRTLAERLDGQRAFVDSSATTLRLSDAIFRQGGSGYLAVLTAEQSLFGAQQSLIALRLEEQTTRVALYKALGGAWTDADGLE